MAVFPLNIHSLIFKKKFGKLGLKHIIKYMLLPVFSVYLVVTVVAFLSNLWTKDDRFAAILLSAHAITDHDHWAPPIAFIGSYPAWTLYFNARGLRTDYIFSATKEDFMRVLQDDKFQSIVLVGHGSYNCWRATDALVTNNDIHRMAGRFREKKGEWFQLSCPERDYTEIHLGELVMNSENVYYYQGDTAGNVDFVIDALTAFTHIKADTRASRKTANRRRR